MTTPKPHCVDVAPGIVRGKTGISRKPAAYVYCPKCKRKGQRAVAATIQAAVVAATKTWNDALAAPAAKPAAKSDSKK